MRDTAELTRALELRALATIRAVELEIEPLEVRDVVIDVPHHELVVGITNPRATSHRA